LKWHYYSKPINLDLLLAPISVHALGVYRGMIFNRLETLIKHCFKVKDYASEVDRFY